MKEFRLADPVVPAAAPSRGLKFLKYLRDLPGLIPAILPLAEARFQLLPIDPAVRDDVLVWTILLSAVAGLGACRSFFSDRLGWAALFVSILCLNGVWVISMPDLALGLSAIHLLLLQRAGYLLLFPLLAVAVGVFLRFGRD